MSEETNEPTEPTKLTLVEVCAEITEVICTTLHREAIPLPTKWDAKDLVLSSILRSAFMAGVGWSVESPANKIVEQYHDVVTLQKHIAQQERLDEAAADAVADAQKNNPS